MKRNKRGKKEGNYNKPQKLKISDGSQKLQKEFLICWKYLKESKIFFLVILVFLLVSALIGILFPVFFLELINKFIEELARKTAGMTFFQLLFFILQNNITTAFLGLLSGIILGIFPLLVSLFNGYVIGFVAGKSVDVAGYPILLRLLPHGIFELPALIISLGLGVKLGMFIFAKNSKEQFKYDLENSLRVFVYIIIPLFLIAGIIETALIFLLI